MKLRKVEMGFSEPDMTPMIDIVFQLLTFFMIAINFENTQADERVRLPIDGLAKPPEVRPEEVVVLNFGYPNRAPGARPVLLYNGDEVPLDAIERKLKMEADLFKVRNKSLSDVSIEIRADAEVPVGMVQELIKQCQAAQFTKFSLKAQQPD